MVKGFLEENQKYFAQGHDFCLTSIHVDFKKVKVMKMVKLSSVNQRLVKKLLLMFSNKFNSKITIRYAHFYTAVFVTIFV